jgi:peptidoglycan hydrolase CwlO-like protein
MLSSEDGAQKVEKRVATLEEAVKLLTELTLRFDERVDDLRGAQENSERKIAALADAQIKTEEELQALASSQRHADQRLDALIDFVERRFGRT